MQNYYQTLYKGTMTWRPDLNLQRIKGINREEQEWLQRQFEDEEFLNVSDYLQVTKHQDLMDFQ